MILIILFLKSILKINQFNFCTDKRNVVIKGACKINLSEHKKTRTRTRTRTVVIVEPEAIQISILLIIQII